MPIYAFDSDKNTPLHKAAKTGSYNTLILIIDSLLKKVESKDTSKSEVDDSRSPVKKPLTEDEKELVKILNA